MEKLWFLQLWFPKAHDSAYNTISIHIHQVIGTLVTPITT